MLFHSILVVRIYKGRKASTSTKKNLSSVVILKLRTTNRMIRHATKKSTTDPKVPNNWVNSVSTFDASHSALDRNEHGIMRSGPLSYHKCNGSICSHCKKVRSSAKSTTCCIYLNLSLSRHNFTNLFFFWEGGGGCGRGVVFYNSTIEEVHLTLQFWAKCLSQMGNGLSVPDTVLDPGFHLSIQVNKTCIGK